jgi:hypothetical protein
MPRKPAGASDALAGGADDLRDSRIEAARSISAFERESNLVNRSVRPLNPL